MTSAQDRKIEENQQWRDECKAKNGVASAAAAADYCCCLLGESGSKQLVDLTCRHLLGLFPH